MLVTPDLDFGILDGSVALLFQERLSLQTPSRSRITNLDRHRKYQQHMRKVPLEVGIGPEGQELVL